MTIFIPFLKFNLTIFIIIYRRRSLFTWTMILTIFPPCLTFNLTIFIITYKRRSLFNWAMSLAERRGAGMGGSRWVRVAGQAGPFPATKNTKHTQTSTLEFKYTTESVRPALVMTFVNHVTSAFTVVRRM